jgi:hypothetical protein
VVVLKFAPQSDGHQLGRALVQRDDIQHPRLLKMDRHGSASSAGDSVREGYTTKTAIAYSTLLYVEDNKVNLELMEGSSYYLTKPTPRWLTIR